MKNFFKKIVIKIITWQATFLLKKNNPKIIAITGNLGKTSTKDFIYTALRKNLLSQKGDSLVLASKKSMNSDIGIPLAILGLESGWTNPFLWIKIIFNSFIKMFDNFPYKYLVLEIGADSPGDIKNVCKYIKPDIVVLTAFAEVPVHVEAFNNDRKKLIREKKYLVENLKEDGIFIYNLDDEDCKKIAKEMEDKNIKIKHFSFNNSEADIYTKNIQFIYEDINKYVNKVKGVSGNIFIKEGENLKVEMKGILGEAVFYSLLPAFLIAKEFGLNLEKVVLDIEKSKRTSGRMRILEGVYNSTIIDDTYNSSPKALRHGIQVVQNIETRGKKIFVLGDMLELGDFTRSEHENIGKFLVGICDILITSGIRAKFIAEAAFMAGMPRENIFVVNGSLEAARETLLILENEVEKDYKQGRSEREIGGDLIFVKGSQGARMEKVVRMILNREAHNPEEDLVRQEKVWEYK